jgi:hypothetical protein
MIPEEIADLADALIAEFGHELSRDEAVAKANRIVRYMNKKGHDIGALTGED